MPAVLLTVMIILFKELNRTKEGVLNLGILEVTGELENFYCSELLFLAYILGKQKSWIFLAKLHSHISSTNGFYIYSTLHRNVCSYYPIDGLFDSTYQFLRRECRNGCYSLVLKSKSPLPV